MKPSDNKKRSKRLIAKPSELNQVKFFPVTGTSTTSIPSIKDENSALSAD
jgi:hypothetical protein